MPGISGISIPIEVVHRLMDGDESAQEEVFRELSMAVHTMALRILGDHAAAEDVTQDTFIDVITKAHTIKQPKLFVGWVRTIAVNRCYMRLRSPWQRIVTDFEPYEQGKPDSTEDWIDIERRMADMPPKTRMVLWLFCVEGYTHEEIAKLLGKSKSYSKVIISRLQHQHSREPDATVDDSSVKDKIYLNKVNWRECNA